MEREIERLLISVSEISEKCDELSRETGRDFNIFELAEIETDEVTVCRIICGLLNPKGNHGQGTAFLKPFFEQVLNIEISDELLETAGVYQNYHIKTETQDRYIDIVIKVGGRVIPIEVKIKAGDEENQCFDYYEHAKNNSKKETYIYYLTKDGKKPKEYSAKNLTPGKEVQCISFNSDIIEWLKACISRPKMIQLSPIREVLVQFKAAIQKFAGEPKDNKMDAIKKIISAKPENMKSAVLIAQCLETSQTDITSKFYNLVDTKIKETGQLETIFNCPSIIYLLRTFPVDDGEPIEARIILQVGWHSVYAGIILFRNCEIITQKIKEYEKILPKELVSAYAPSSKYDRDWVTWEYLPDRDQLNSPNFKEGNDAYYKLFDKDYFDMFVDSAVREIGNYFDKWGNK